MSGPQIPRINTQDFQGHDVVSNASSDDNFASASEGGQETHSQSDAPPSPIPITRVERVDDTAAHGEVPGTPAYSLRTQDAVPDEIEIVPEGRRSRSATLQISGRSRGNSAASISSTGSRPVTPGGTPIPRLVVDRVDNKPAHGEVEGTEAYEKRMADATPDEVRAAPPIARSGENGQDQIEQDPEDRQAWFRSMWEGKQDEAETPRAPTQAESTLQQEISADDEGLQDDDDFGDDFDDFAEGGEDDDFGDFDEPETPAPVPEAQTYSLPDTLSGLPPLNLKPDMSDSDLQDNISPYLDLIFPGQTAPPPLSAIPPLDMSNSSPFLSDRSLSLWQQLVQPPPMQPPNWTRSKIRRLFLVSLGVPVDLDEILPPSKQKRLVLPNINLNTSDPRQLDRLKSDGANESTTSLDSKTGASKRSGQHKRTGTMKGPPPPPDFDSNRAALICRTTEEAMKNMEDDELKEHLKNLEVMNREASKVLEYWLLRKDEGLKEKEALEGVIENLVGFVKGRRGGGK